MLGATKAGCTTLLLLFPPPLHSPLPRPPRPPPPPPPPSCFERSCFNFEFLPKYLNFVPSPKSKRMGTEGPNEDRNEKTKVRVLCDAKVYEGDDDDDEDDDVK